MMKELIYKLFRLELPVCKICETLREQLDKSERERTELLHRLLDKDKPESSIQLTDELKSIQPNFIPWRVKQQLLEAEDRKKAELMRNKDKEISELEKELGITQ